MGGGTGGGEVLRFHTYKIAVFICSKNIEGTAQLKIKNGWGGGGAYVNPRPSQVIENDIIIIIMEKMCAPSGV